MAHYPKGTGAGTVPGASQTTAPPMPPIQQRESVAHGLRQLADRIERGELMLYTYCEEFEVDDDGPQRYPLRPTGVFRIKMRIGKCGS